MEALMDHKALAEITAHFAALTDVIPLHPVCSARDYDEAVATLNRLLDAGVANETHPLADLVDTLGTLIAEYEDSHYLREEVSPVAMLKFLMDQHRLSQSELAEIGSQRVVSGVLSGKRELNTRQIRALADRFKVPASLFGRVE